MLVAASGKNDPERTPRLAPGWDPSGRSLSPAEGFLLSRIDGQTPWAQLRHIGGIPPGEVDRCLQRWISEGVLLVEGAEPRDEAPQAGAGESELEPEIDLPLDFQRTVLAFEANLERSYHEILGVAPDVDAKGIKRAYFALSKRFHPDRYYRRELGGFRKRLERVFKKIAEAYELLSDPTTRAEIERSLAQAAPPASEPAAPGTGRKTLRRAPSRKRLFLERLRKQFRIPEEVLAERRFKARQFFQAAMVAGKRGQWLEAASNVRLAIAFDPWNDEYKTSFAQVQAQVHQARATQLLEQAGALDAGAQHEAMRLLEEALSYRPGDAEINDRAARLALELSDLAQAREYAEAACELRPDVASYQVTLGRVLRRDGRTQKARAALEEALRVDPGNEEARTELSELQRKAGRRGGGTQ